MTTPAAEPLPVPTPERPLRMGIMCAGTVFEHWQAAVIRELLATRLVTPALLISDADPKADRPSRTHQRSLLDRTIRNKRLAWNLYQRRFVAGRGTATRPTDLSPELAMVPCVPCRAPKSGAWARVFTPAEVGAIRAADLDFVLRFAFNIIKGEILTTPRLGVWSFHHDDLDLYRGMPACFWPTYFADPVQGVTLQRLTEGLDKGVVLQRAWYRAIPHSYVRSRDAAFSASADLPAKVCRDLAAGDGAGAYLLAPPSRTSAINRTSPTNLQTTLFVLKLARRKAASLLSTLFRHDQWAVGLIDQPIHTLLNAGAKSTTCPSARWIPNKRRGTFIADPFGIHSGQTLTILAEELDDRDPRGRIVALDWPDAGEPGPVRTVIDRTFHLSYPYLLQLGGSIYCIPEAADSGSIQILRAASFPDRWEPFATIATGVPAIDTTVFWHEQRWWALAALKSRPTELKLHAWHANSLEGPWHPHAANPLKSDVRSTRPAGTPFHHAGILYRPAQDCSATYGGAVVLNRVETLTPTRFAEFPETVIRPDPRSGFPNGLHTISAVGSRTLVDAKRTIFIPGQCLRELRRLGQKVFPR